MTENETINSRLIEPEYREGYVQGYADALNQLLAKYRAIANDDEDMEVMEAFVSECLAEMFELTDTTPLPHHDLYNDPYNDPFADGGDGESGDEEEWTVVTGPAATRAARLAELSKEDADDVNEQIARAGRMILRRSI